MGPACIWVQCVPYFATGHRFGIGNGLHDGLFLGIAKKVFFEKHGISVKNRILFTHPSLPLSRRPPLSICLALAKPIERGGVRRGERRGELFKT